MFDRGCKTKLTGVHKLWRAPSSSVGTLIVGHAALGGGAVSQNACITAQ